ncbi:MAG: hypothetical protein M0024_09015 [Nitrospiraceae bacterium]|nr:hypothetical protein [Nitrospiraceae bacterium]
MINIIGQTVSSQDGAGRTENMALPQYTHPVLCPYLADPFEECYCTSSSSMVVESTIMYCGGDFRKCEIYAKHTSKG